MKLITLYSCANKGYAVNDEFCANNMKFYKNGISRFPMNPKVRNRGT